jgi:hypothetical protein
LLVSSPATEGEFHGFRFTKKNTASGKESPSDSCTLAGDVCFAQLTTGGGDQAVDINDVL